MTDESDPGKVIDQAMEIVRKTYQEINAMKNDITNIIQEKYPRYNLIDDYSFGPKYLFRYSTSLFMETWRRYVDII